MPIAHFPPSGPGPGGVTPQLLVKPPNAIPDPTTTFLVGHAVALVDVAGTPTYFLCGANPANRPDLFIGFVKSASAVPGTTEIVTGRGSTLAPVVEGGGPLTVNAGVFLATTPGEVTQTAPTGPNQVIIQVGFAASTSAITLTTDPRHVIP